MPLTPPSEPVSWSPPKPAAFEERPRSAGEPGPSIAVFTSGGDAPGMNAAIRAIVRAAEYRGYGVLGVRRGFWGCLDDNVQPPTSRDVRGIIQRGGAPTARDRVLASRLGVAAVEVLLEGKDRVMVGVREGGVVQVPLEEIFTRKRRIDTGLIQVLDILKG